MTIGEDEFIFSWNKRYKPQISVPTIRYKSNTIFSYNKGIKIEKRQKRYTATFTFAS